MKHLEKAHGDSVLCDIVCLDGIQKTGPKRVVGAGGKKKTSWTSFLIRNDFGIVNERHETRDVWPMFMHIV
jgi:hypothetical protein